MSGSSLNEAIGVGVIGVGYWGPKLVRNFMAAPGARMQWVADLEIRLLDDVRTAFPQMRTTRDYRELLAADDVDAIVIATPVSTHARLATEALRAGKHLLVEKPLSDSVSSAEALVDLAAAQQRVLMVGHTFVYHPAVRVLRDLVQNGDLGRVFYANAQRLNLGIFQ